MSRSTLASILWTRNYQWMSHSLGFPWRPNWTQARTPNHTSCFWRGNPHRSIVRRTAYSYRLPQTRTLLRPSYDPLDFLCSRLFIVQDPSRPLRSTNIHQLLHSRGTKAGEVCSHRSTASIPWINDDWYIRIAHIEDFFAPLLGMVLQALEDLVRVRLVYVERLVGDDLPLLGSHNLELDRGLNVWLVKTWETITILLIYNLLQK